MKLLTAMRIRLLQHSPEVPPGSVLEWLDSKSLPYKLDRLYAGEPLPSVDEADWLIALGGEMNCDDEAAFPFLSDEKRLLAQAVEQNKAVLGLCLGGQILARALGAEVRQHDGWEVGWHPIQVASAARIVAFQWHQDVFDLPAGAQRIASNQFCQNQGFLFGAGAVGLQFHPEATEEWILACAQSPAYPAGPHVQPPEQIVGEIGFLPPLRKWFFSLLEQMEHVARAAAARER
jgi:GMP synthase (glutamine-hydrolysing)